MTRDRWGVITASKRAQVLHLLLAEHDYRRTACGVPASAHPSRKAKPIMRCWACRAAGRLEDHADT